LRQKITARGGKKRGGTHFIHFFENSLNIRRLSVGSKWFQYSVYILNCPSFFCGKLRGRITARARKRRRHAAPVAALYSLF
jgi:hypothetical protein